MRRNAIGVLAVVVVVAAGCTGGVGPYRSINLNQNLDAATLSRYQAEARQLPAGQQAGVLEHTNWWPLGLLAYWRQGTVKDVTGADGKPLYMVSASAGYGPLSIFYVSGTQAMYAADGTRLNASRASSILWGHLAMIHHMGSRQPSGQWAEHDSSSWAHMLLYLDTIHGHTSWSLFSGPGPIGSGR